MWVYYWLVFIVPMPDYHLWAYQVGPLTVIKCVGILTLVAALVRLAVRRRVPPFYRLPEAWCCLLYLLVAFVSYSARDLAVGGAEPLEKVLAVLALLIVTAIMVDTPDRFQWSVLVAVAGEAICSLYVLRQWLQFRLVYTEFRSFGGLTDDANYFALSAVLWLPVALLWVGKGATRLKRTFWAGSVLVMFVGFLLSGSRGGLLALALAGLLLVWRTRQRVRNLALVVLGAMAALAVSTLSGSSALNRLLHPSAGDVYSTQSRLELWQVGFRVVEHHPLLGVGSNAWTYALSYHAHYNVSHNTYLDVLGQLGLVGFLPFMGILVFAFRRVGRLADAATLPELRRTAAAFRASLGGYFVAAFFLSSWWQQVLWLLVFLSMTMPFLEPVPVDLRERSRRFGGIAIGGSREARTSEGHSEVNSVGSVSSPSRRSLGWRR